MALRLYILQRATAILMVPLIVVHLVVILYASRQGLSAADILGRTRGSLGWGLYYASFVVLASVHGAIGLRAVLSEWGPSFVSDTEARLNAAMWAAGLVLTALGLRAVWAVVIA